MATPNPIETNAARVAPNQMLPNSENRKATVGGPPIVVVDDDDVPSNNGEAFRLTGHSDAFSRFDQYY